MSANVLKGRNPLILREEARSETETRIPASTTRIFEALSASEIVRDYEESFACATGLPLKLLPVGTVPAPIPFRMAQNLFCVLLCSDVHSARGSMNWSINA